MKTPLLTIVLSSLLIITGCNTAKYTAVADKAAAEFHRQFNVKDFDKIYNTAHDDFQSVQPKEDTINFIRLVREKLGSVKSSRRTSWQAKNFNMKKSVVLTLETEFENGRGVETFTYHIKNGDAILLGWYINSNALILTQKSGEQGGAHQSTTRSESKPK